MVVNVRQAAVIAAAVLVAGGLLYWALRDSESNRVRRRFDRLSELARVVPGAHIVATGLASRNLAELFTDPATLRTPLHEFGGTYSRQQIVQSALALKGSCERLELTFADLDTRFPSPGNAVCTVTARAKGVHRSGGAFAETHELDCKLVKDDGEWRFTDCTVVDVLVR